MNVDQGGAKRPQETQESSGQKKARAIQFSLPDGAQVIPNRGEGNCFFHALAATTSHAESQDQSHRQARVALVAWMRKYQANLSQHWDKRMPDDRPTSLNFDQDLDTLLERVGAWGGWRYLNLPRLSNSMF